MIDLVIGHYNLIEDEEKHTNCVRTHNDDVIGNTFHDN